MDGGMNLGDVRQIRVWLQLLDGMLAAAAMTGAYFLRVHVLPEIFPLESREIGEFSIYIPYIALIGVLAPVVLGRRGLYRSFSTRGRKGNWIPLVEAGLVLFLVGISVIFFFKQTPSRLVFIFFVPLFFLMLLAREELLHRFQNLRRHADRYTVRLLLASDSLDHSERWLNLLSDCPAGIRITRTFPAGTGSVEDFTQALHDDSAGIVLFDVTSRHMDWTAQAIKACEEEGVEAWLSTDFVADRLRPAPSFFGARAPGNLDCHPTGVSRSRPFPPAAQRSPWRPLRHVQVPDHAHGRGDAQRRAGRPQRDAGPGFQDQERPPRHPGGRLPPHHFPG
ncbi:MAG: hypothetical protein EBT95_02530 [Verrucomicrobia bacterium]|nr:hypothetical protein [Verrucomicrobiota bacterium]